MVRRTVLSMPVRQYLLGSRNEGFLCRRTHRPPSLRRAAFLRVAMQEQMPDLVRDRERSGAGTVLASARRRDDDGPIHDHNREGVDAVSLPKRVYGDDTASLRRGDRVPDRPLGQSSVRAGRSCGHRRRRSRCQRQRCDVVAEGLAVTVEDG